VDHIAESLDVEPDGGFDTPSHRSWPRGRKRKEKRKIKPNKLISDVWIFVFREVGLNNIIFQ
jgi:hypothetical protein